MAEEDDVGQGRIQRIRLARTDTEDEVGKDGYRG